MKKNIILIGFFLIIAILFPLVIQSEYLIHIMILAFMYILLTQGLNLLAGYVGQLSLGHQAFLGIGGYTSAILAIKLGIPVIFCNVACRDFYGCVQLSDWDAYIPYKRFLLRYHDDCICRNCTPGYHKRKRTNEWAYGYKRYTVSEYFWI